MILEFLQKLKFTKTNADYSVFISYDKLTFILIYMNNLLIISKNLNIINSLKNNLSKYFYITNLGLVSHYLGISVIQTGELMNLNQKSYL